MHLRIT